MRKLLSLLLALSMLFSLSACAIEYSDVQNAADEIQSFITVSGEEDCKAPASEELIDPDGTYSAMEDVAEYLYVYGKLPNNFITKKEAKALGWSGGGLDGYADGMCIGGDYFGNYEGLLPKAEGREYHECDIDTLHADSRGAKRIIYSNDGLIYYTEDHYKSFTLICGDENNYGG